MEQLHSEKQAIRVAHLEEDHEDCHDKESLCDYLNRFGRQLVVIKPSEKVVLWKRLDETHPEGVRNFQHPL